MTNFITAVTLAYMFYHQSLRMKSKINQRAGGLYSENSDSQDSLFIDENTIASKSLSTLSIDNKEYEILESGNAKTLTKQSFKSTFKKLDTH